MKTAKRFWAFLLVLALLCTIAPFQLTVAAEETAPSQEVSPNATGIQVVPIGTWINPIYEGTVSLRNLPTPVVEEKTEISVQSSFVGQKQAAAQLREQMTSRA